MKRGRLCLLVVLQVSAAVALTALDGQTTMRGLPAENSRQTVVQTQGVVQLRGIRKLWHWASQLPSFGGRCYVQPISDKCRAAIE